METSHNHCENATFFKLSSVNQQRAAGELITACVLRKPSGALKRELLVLFLTDLSVPCLLNLTLTPVLHVVQVWRQSDSLTCMQQKIVIYLFIYFILFDCLCPIQAECIH